MAYHHHADIQQVQYAETQQISNPSTQQFKAILREQPKPASVSQNNSRRINHSISIQAFSKHLSSISATTSSQKCAASIRVALQSAGARIVNHPVAAADWGNTLKDLGYRQIKPAFEKPQQGDIYIIDRTKSHIYGHIAGFTGKEWVSDFKQAGHAVYKGNVSYRYFRLGS